MYYYSCRVCIRIEYEQKISAGGVSVRTGQRQGPFLHLQQSLVLPIIALGKKLQTEIPNGRGFRKYKSLLSSSGDNTQGEKYARAKSGIVSSCQSAQSSSIEVHFKFGLATLYYLDPVEENKTPSN